SPKPGRIIAGMAGIEPAAPPPPGADAGDCETRAIGPTPNSGRPVEPDALRPALGSRACNSHPLGYGRPRRASSRARPRQSTTHRTRRYARLRRLGRPPTVAQLPCDNPTDDHAARPPAEARPTASPVSRSPGPRQGQGARAGPRAADRPPADQAKPR